MLRPVHDVENVLSDAAFWTALVVAAIGTALVWVRLRRDEFEPGIAFVVLVSCCVGLREEHLLPACTRGRGRAPDARGVPDARCWTARPAGLAAPRRASCSERRFPMAGRFGCALVAAGAAVFGGLLAVAADRRAPRLVPALLACGALGVYLCVPDTEAPKALLGALLAAAVLGLEPRLRHRLGFAAVAGLVAWIAVYGGVGRSGSVVGGIASLGVVVLLPLVPRWSPTRWTVASDARRAGCTRRVRLEGCGVRGVGLVGARTRDPRARRGVGVARAATPSGAVTRRSPRCWRRPARSRTGHPCPPLPRPGARGSPARALVGSRRRVRMRRRAGPGSR